MIRFLEYFLLMIFFCSVLSAQAVSRNEYLDYLPLEHEKIVEQTPASAALHLYGNKSAPGYSDKNPIDGIDDYRFDVLQKMGVRFAPFLIQNTIDLPLDIKVFMEGKSAFPLNIDVWDVTPEHRELINSEMIDFANIGESDCKQLFNAESVTDAFELHKDLNNDDCKLLALIDEFHPEHPRGTSYNTAKRSMTRELFKVMYFDLPGDGPETWKDEYEDPYTKLLSKKYRDHLKIYVHPFIKDYYRKSEKQLLGYELIIQYWFFYAYNDGGNNHEGDWEHINVVVSPKNKVTRLLSADEIETMLNGAWEGKDKSDEELVIKRVENYLHHYVMPLDYSRPNVYKSKENWEKEIDEMVLERFGERDILEKIRYRAYIDDEETEINTHPFIYIGGDNKGTDQIMSSLGGTNRDSHASYPFAGLYKNIGPMGASEQLDNFVDHREYFKDLAENGEQLPVKYGRGNVVGFNRDDRIEIVPDWERLIDLIETNKEVRHRWSWLVLPLRLGYPATESPFAGIVKHADTGNQGDIGPAFTTWWNTSLGAAGVHVYQPHELPPLFPVGFQDSFDNSIGFFNLTYPVLLNLPPLDFAWRIAAYPFRALLKRQDPVFYPEKQIPFRFFDAGVGVSYQVMDADFSYLIFNKTQFPEFLSRLVDHIQTNLIDSTTYVIDFPENLENPTTPFYQVNFHIGDHFTSENTFRYYKSKYSFDFVFNNIPDFSYETYFHFWEFSGSIRYSLLTSAFRPFLKIGYGWNWYRLEDTKINGQILINNRSEWFNKPSFKSFGDIMPNTFHIGAGFEAVLLKSYAQFPKGIDMNLRLEYDLFIHDIGLNLDDVALIDLATVFDTLQDVPNSGTLLRHNFNLTFSIGF